MSNGWVDEKDYVPSTGISGAAKYAGRSALRTAARGIEELGGGFGSLVGFAGDILNTVTKGRVFGEKEGESLGLGEPLKKLPLPTRETVRNYVTGPLAKAFGADIEPETKGEKRYDEAVQDFVSFFNPTTGPISGFGRALGLTAVGNLGRFFAESLGASEGTQQVVKAGSMFGGALAHSMLDFKTDRLIEEGKKLYSQSEYAAEKLISASPEKKIRQWVPRLRTAAKKSLADVNKINKKAWGTAEEKAAGFLTGMLEDINKGKNRLGIDQIPAYKKRINNSLYNLTASDKQAMERYVLPVKSALIDELESMGKKYPQVSKPILQADQLYTTAYGINRALENVKEATKGSGFKSGMTSYLLGQALGPYAGVVHAAGSAVFKVAKGIPGALQLADVVAKSPAARKYWKYTFQAALKGNLAQTARFARKLDEVLKSEEDNKASDWAPEI